MHFANQITAKNISEKEIDQILLIKVSPAFTKKGISVTEAYSRVCKVIFISAMTLDNAPAGGDNESRLATLASEKLDSYKYANNYQSNQYHQ